MEGKALGLKNETERNNNNLPRGRLMFRYHCFAIAIHLWDWDLYIVVYERDSHDLFFLFLLMR